MRDDFPLPDTDHEATREFWAGAARGELLIPRCDGCDRYQWYPRRECRGCGASTFTWTPMSGRAQLFSWVVVTHPFLPQFADKVPYVPGLVSLEEDPAVRIVTDIVECDPEALEFGMPLEVVFGTLSFPGIEREVAAPLFRPAR